MQKFIRIFGLLFLIISFGACVKEDIPTFGQKIHQNWQLETELTFLYFPNDSLDIMEERIYSNDTLFLFDFGKDDSISKFIGTGFLAPDGIEYYDTLEFERLYWEDKSDNEIKIVDDVYEVFYLEFGELILKQFIYELADPIHPFRIIESRYKPFLGPEPLLEDPIF